MTLLRPLIAYCPLKKYLLMPVVVKLSQKSPSELELAKPLGEARRSDWLNQ